MYNVYTDTSSEVIEKLRQQREYQEIKSSISRPLKNLAEAYSITTIAGEKYRFDVEKYSGEVQKFNTIEERWETTLSLANFGIDCSKWLIRSIIPSPSSARALVNLAYKRGDLKKVIEIDVERGLVITPQEGGFFAPPGNGGLVWVGDDAVVAFIALSDEEKTHAGHPRKARLWSRFQEIERAPVLSEVRFEDLTITVQKNNEYGLITHHHSSNNKTYYLVNFYEQIEHRLDIPLDAQVFISKTKVYTVSDSMHQIVINAFDFVWKDEGFVIGGGKAVYRFEEETVIRQVVPCFLLGAFFAIISFSTAVLIPVFTASLKQLVPRSEFAQAMGANEARSALLALAVPPLAGFLMSVSGILPLAVAMVCLTSSIFLFPAVPSGVALESNHKIHLSEFFSGFSIIWRNNVLKTLVVSGMLINVAVSTVMLVLIFSFKEADIDPMNIGLAQTGVAIGATVGAAASGYLGTRVKSGFLIIFSLLWILIWLLFIVSSSDILTTAIFAALAVIPGPILNATLMGYTLAIIPESQQGRSDVALSLIASGAAPLAPFIAGVGTASLPGNLPILVSVILVLVAVCLCCANSGVRSLQKGAEWTSAEK